jgi:ABC-2 type transport system permease protein
MMRYLRLVGVQLRVSAAAAMQYRANFVIEGLMSFGWMALTLLPLAVVYAGRPSVAGWDGPSALIVMAYFVGVHAVLEGVVSPSLVDMVERIRSGAFDYVLLKPVDAQALISASRYEPWKIVDLLAAIGLTVYAFYLRGSPPAAIDVASGIALFFAGCLAMYSLWLACAAMAFWVVRLDNLTFLLGSIFDVARWPIQVFRGLWRIIFTFVIPVAVMTTFPAMALLGRGSTRLTLATVGGALLMLVISRLVWRTAIRNYTSASS